MLLSPAECRVALLRCRAYNECITRHLLVLIEMIENGDAPPNEVTLLGALQPVIREAAEAAKSA